MHMLAYHCQLTGGTEEEAWLLCCICGLTQQFIQSLQPVTMTAASSRGSTNIDMAEATTPVAINTPKLAWSILAP